ncbi:hypothetical protein ANCCAN_04902 [Ancylostoma caninum]|uniref:Uncharacterized protein n=1 Tax=Ancylostoma caninum TaxID=29170 RepID=A0A368H177_ANCCA|nr:hypothetical protein ANCCAN_04902 [Ancylostoma caninum]
MDCHHLYLTPSPVSAGGNSCEQHYHMSYSAADHFWKLRTAKDCHLRFRRFCTYFTGCYWIRRQNAPKAHQRKRCTRTEAKGSSRSLRSNFLFTSSLHWRKWSQRRT